MLMRWFSSILAVAALLFPVLVTLRPSVALPALQIEVRPLGPSRREVETSVRTILDTSELSDELSGTDYRVLSVRRLGPWREDRLSGFPRTEVSADSRTPPPITPAPGFELQVYDYTHDRLLTVNQSSTGIQVHDHSELQFLPPPPPTFEEFLDAVTVIEKHPTLGPLIKKGALKPYQAMPHLLTPTPESGKRVLPVGLRPIASPDASDTSAAHEIVAVDLSRRRLLRYERKSPGNSLATAHVCGVPSAEQGITPIGTAGSAVITARSNGDILWKMNATRPAASTGRWGSGIELREIYYRGRLVLQRAHVPILNVDYIGDVCGPFRDHVNHENAFAVDGSEFADGFVRTADQPVTFFETGRDEGDFWGVAVYQDDDELILVSELSAGWYRYASEFRFASDGSIRPSFKFDAVHNSCTCEAHNHHVYWRFDFDVDGAPHDSMEVLTANGWRAVQSEEKFTRGASAQAWRVRSSETARGFEIRPGPYDSTANEFGVADAWVLKYHTGEVDDSALGSSQIAKLDSFRNGESVQSSDLVFWYAGHIMHDEEAEDAAHAADDEDAREAEEEPPRIAGPTFIPLQ